MRLQSLLRVRPGLRMALLPAAIIGLALLALLAGAPSASAQTPGYLQVSAGLYHTCAIQGLYGEAGPVECWGYDYYGEATPPAGDFKQVTAGGYHTCGLKPDGSAQCWGSNEVLLECTETGCVYLYGGQASPPATRFKQISAGLYHTCGVTVDGNVDCWGYNPHGETADRTGANWLEVSAGEGHTCALREDGVADCWGNNENGRAADRTGPFTHVSAGGSHNCAIRQNDGKAECWGGNLYGQSKPPDQAFAQISAGNLHTCATRADSDWPNWVVCWGYNFYGQVKQAPDGQFRQIDSGQGHTCGVTFTNAVYCWGRNNYGQANVPGLGSPGGGEPYDFEGFYPPVESDPALNVVKAGRSVPLKFSLGGDKGLDVVEAGWPASRPLECATMDPSGELQPVQPAGRSGLSYDPATDTYTYVWKTDQTWAGTCRVLSLRLTDGTEHLAAFSFR
jgi:alpha-tubulin suppressor-like RCC1 family protein